MILKEDGSELFCCALAEVRPASPASLGTSSTCTSAEVPTSTSLFLNDTFRGLSDADGACFFAGLTPECSLCFAFFASRSVVLADFGLEDISEGPEIGVRGPTIR